MKTLFQYFTGGGGALSNVILLLKAFSKQYPDDQIDIVCSKSSGLSCLDSLLNVNVLPFGAGKYQEVDRLLLGYGGLKRIANQRQSDIIWSLNLGSYIKTDIPHVLSIHNPHQVYPWHVTRCHPDNRLNVLGLRWFFRKSLRVSDGVIVQTPIMGEYVRKITGAPSRIRVVPKAVENSDDMVFKTLSPVIQNMFDSGLGNQAFTFLYVSTYTPHKNHVTLVEAYDVLANKGINTRVAFTLKRDELVSLGGERVNALIDSGHIIPLGWTEKIYLKSLYDACDACLMPSVLESLSSAHLEAMQWGKPQITADLPYSRDLCDDAAVYVAAEEPLAWSDAIEKFMNDSNLREKLVLSGYVRMRLFPKTWDEAAILIHNCLEEMLIQK